MRRQKTERELPVRAPRSRLVSWSGRLLILMALSGAASVLGAQEQASEPQRQSASGQQGRGADAEPAGDGGLGGLLEGLDLGGAAETGGGTGEDSMREDSTGNGGAAGRSATDEPPGNAAGDPAASGEDSESAPWSPLVEAYRSMRTAESLLAEGDAGMATLTAQQRAVDLLGQLIEAAQQQQQSGGGSGTVAPTRSPADGSEGPPGQRGQEADGQAEREPGGAGDGDASPGDPGREAEGQGSLRGGGGEPAGKTSAEVATAGSGAGAAAARGESVWGHLPERTRGMLRSEVPTEYLPQYAEETSEYFRILAEMNPDE